jgi:hypothetical protein
MSRVLGFRSTISSLRFRLITLGIVGLVFAEALVLAAGKAQGWSYHLTVLEVLFEILVLSQYWIFGASVEVPNLSFF